MSTLSAASLAVRNPTADMCKAGLWDIKPAEVCPICAALPDTDCGRAAVSSEQTFDADQLEMTLPPGTRFRGAPVTRWVPWTPDEQFAIDCRCDGLDGYSRGRFVEVVA